MGNTLAEKILMRNTGVQSCRPGDIVITKPDMVMFHDIYTPFVYEKFKEMGFTKFGTVRKSRLCWTICCQLA